MSISGFLAIALAIEILCFCPQERLFHHNATYSSNQSSISFINSSDSDILEAFSRFSIVLSFSFNHKKILSLISHLNKNAFCGIYHILSLNAF
jgi:hypothetical protein